MSDIDQEELNEYDVSVEVCFKIKSRTLPSSIIMDFDNFARGQERQSDEERIIEYTNFKPCICKVGEDLEDDEEV